MKFPRNDRIVLLIGQAMVQLNIQHSSNLDFDFDIIHRVDKPRSALARGLKFHA